MLGKTASRHIDNLKHLVFRECQGLFDLSTKPCSVVFNAHKDESYVNGGEEYLTFNPGAILGGTRVDFDNDTSTGEVFGKPNVIAETAVVSGDLRTLTPEQLARARETMTRIVDKLKARMATTRKLTD